MIQLIISKKRLEKISYGAGELDVDRGFGLGDFESKLSALVLNIFNNKQINKQISVIISNILPCC